MRTRHFPTVAAFLAAYPDLWRWPDFTPREIACRDGSIMIDTDAMDKLQALRTALGEAFHVQSAYRSPAHNAAVGGAAHSRHMQALAFDIGQQNHDPHAFQTAAREHGFHGIGRYCTGSDWFIHIDARPEAEAAVWGHDFPFGEDDHPAPAFKSVRPHDVLAAGPAPARETDFGDTLAAIDAAAAKTTGGRLKNKARRAAA